MQTPDRQFEEIRRLGSFDGTGSYSIDLTLPLERLESEQVLNPGLYYLHLVAAGVARGADTLEVRTESRRSVFKFDRGVPFEDLHELIPSLFLKRPSPARVYLRELALGICSARSLGLAEASLSSWLPERSEGARMEIIGTVLKATPLAQPPWQGGQELTRLELRGRRARREFFSLSTAPKAPEESWERVRWAPIPIIRDGSAVNRSLVFEPCKLFCLIGNPPWAPGESHYRRLSTDGSFTGYLALGVPRKGGLTVVSDGVAFPSLDLGVKGAEALVYTSGLVRRSDLSDLVHNQELEMMIRQVRGKIRDLLVATAAVPEQLNLVRELLAELPEEPPEGLALSPEEIVEAFDKVPLFNRRDGSPATPGELAQEQQSHGLILVVEQRGPNLESHNPVVREQAVATLLDRLFPDQVKLDADFTEEPCLAQVELTEPWGLARLTNRPWEPPLVRLLKPQGASDELTTPSLPHGFRAAIRAQTLEKALPALKTVLPILYEQLVERAEDPLLVKKHLLRLFRNLVEIGASLKRILAVPKLRALADRLTFDREGEVFSLVQVVESGVDPETLSLEDEELESLRTILSRTAITGH